MAKLTRIVIRKRKADVTYNLYNTTVEEIQSVSPVSGFEHANATDYLSLYDRIFPPAITDLPENPDQNYSLENLLFAFCHGQIMASTAQNVTQASLNELILMPWVIQQYIEWTHLPDRIPSVDNILSVSFMQKISKISLAPGSFFMFSFTCIATQLWCLFRLYPTLRPPRPILSSFPDLDLLNKIRDSDSFLLISRSGPGATTTTVVEKMTGMRINLQEIQGREHSEAWELEDVRG